MAIIKYLFGGCRLNPGLYGIRVLRINSVLYRMGRLRSPYDPSLVHAYAHAYACVCTRVHEHVEEGTRLHCCSSPEKPPAAEPVFCSAFAALSSPTHLTCCPVTGLEEVAHNKMSVWEVPVHAHKNQLNLPIASFAAIAFQIFFARDTPRGGQKRLRYAVI